MPHRSLQPPQPPRRPPLLPSLRKALKGRRRADRVVVLGIGSELRSDDAVGLRVAALLKERPVPAVAVVDGGSAPENAAAEIRSHSPSVVVMVDTADIGESPGTARVLDPDAAAGASFATHGLPLGVLAGYLRKELGCRVVLVGIQPARVGYGEGISAEAEAGAREVAAAIAAAVAAAGAE